MSLSVRPLSEKKRYTVAVRYKTEQLYFLGERKHMRKDLTEIIFILDCSGSMSGL